MTHTIALAGLGRAAREIHLPAYAGIPGLRVVGGCDPAVPSGRLPFAQYGTVEELLARARPEILAVLAPPAEHFALTCLGLQAGCHVLCEKPFVETLAQADEVIALARRAQRVVVVNNQYRFMDVHAEARRWIGTPEFGELLFLDAHQSFLTTPETEAGWRGRERRRTCQEFGTHVLDLCRFLFGEDPAAVTARMPRPARPDGPDYLNLIRLDFSGERCAQVTLDRLSRGPQRYLALRLDGSLGQLQTELGGVLGLHLGVRGGTRRPFAEWHFVLGGRARLFHGERSRTLAKEPLDVFAQATRRLVQALLEALERGQRPPCDAEDNRRTLALMLAAYESDERRATLPMSY